MSIVSANFFDWLNGGATRGGVQFATSTKRVTNDGFDTSLRERLNLRPPEDRISLRQSGSSSTSFCPRGWTQIFYSLNGKENKCCVPRPK